MVGDVIRGVPPERRVRRWLSRRHSSLALRRSALLLVVTLLGTVMGSLTGTQPASASVGDYRDEFLTAAFDGDDGTLTWSTDWIESGESNGPGDGSIQILVNSYCSQTTCLVLGRNGGEPDAGIEREADFAGVGTAILRFDYKRHKHGGAGQVDLEVSANGGIDWDALDAWSLTATDGEQYTPSYDISAYTSANTRIRFRVTGSTDDSHLNVDNLEIVGSAGTPDTYLKGDGVPSASLGSAPVQVTLPNHDPGYDNEPGRLVKKTGGGLNEVDATKYQQWVAPALQRSLNGPVLLGLWSAMKDFKVGKRGWFEAGLYDCRPGGSECNLLASAQLDLADWSGGTADWVYREIDFGSVTATIPPGRSLAVKVVVDNSADDDMWLAYDTVSYPSRLSVTLANQPPTFDQDLGDRSDAGGSLITIASPATDPNLSALTYTATGLPQGISIDAGSGDIRGALGPDAAGVHAVSILVTDDGSPSLQDLDTFTWTVTPGEVTYLIANTGGGAGGDDLLTAVDRTDADPLTNEVSIGAGTGTTNIEAASLQPGTDVLFAIEDDRLGTVDVTSGVFTAAPLQVGTGNGPVGPARFDNIEGLAFNPFTGDLYASHRRGFGSEDLLFQIDPSSGAHVAGAFGGDDYMVIERQGVHYHVGDMSFDPTSGLLYIAHWTLLGAYSLATLDPVTGATSAIGVTPDDIMALAFDEVGRLWAATDQLGAESLYELNKSDGSVITTIPIDNGADYESLAISYPLVANSAPAFDQDLPDRIDPEGAVVSHLAAATDPDIGDVLGYTATGLPPGLGIDLSSGLISGTITFAATGVYPVTITVADDGIPNLSDVDTFTWTVTELNRAPVFDQDLLDRVDPEGAVISVAAGATDPDASDMLTYSATALPPGLTVDPTTGLISGTIGFTASGLYATEITVTDDGVPVLAATDPFSWTVSNTNRPPVIINPGAQTTPELALLTIVVAATDPDTTIPSFTDSGTLPIWAALVDNLDGTSTISGTPGPGDAGTTTVTITASDGGIPVLSDDAVFDITVTNTNLPPTISNPGNQTTPEGSLFSLVISAADPDLTTVSFSDAGSLPGWATLTDNLDDTATISGTPGFTDSGVTTVTITASDGLLFDDAVFDVTVTDTNRPPVVDAIADRTIAENDPFVLVVTASDPDLTIPFLTDSGTLPAWVTLVDNLNGTATISGTPGFTDSGVSTVTITAEDGGVPNLSGDVVFDLTVMDTNRPPVVNPIGDQSVAEGSALPVVIVTSSDPDGTVPSLSPSGLPGWAGFVDLADGTALITGTPGHTDAGVSTVTVTASDGSLFGSSLFDLTVTNVNRPPVIDPVADQTVAENDAFTVTVTASDPDLTVPLLTDSGTLPGWATLTDNLDGTATITGTPGFADAGVTTVTLTASDGGLPDLSDDDVFDLTVTNTNRSPSLDPVGDHTAPEQVMLSFVAAGSDPDLDLLLFSLVDGVDAVPAGASIDPISGVFAWMPTELEGPGSYEFKLRLTDTGSPTLFDEEQVTFTINEVNVAPVITNPGGQINGEGDTVSLFVAGADMDQPSNTITWSATSLPPGLSIDSASGEISGTVDALAVSGTPYAAMVMLTDDGRPSMNVSAPFTWTVVDTNRSPVVGPIADHTIDEHSSLSFNATGSDPDLDSIAYGLVDGTDPVPVGAAIDPVTGLLSWVPSEAQGPDEYEFIVRVTDGGTPSLFADRAITITVTEVNQAPVLGSIADVTVSAGDLVSFTASATDGDLPLNALTFSVSGEPAGAAMEGASGAFTWIPSEAQAPGSYVFTVTVTDSGVPAKSGARLVIVTVVADPDIPAPPPAAAEPIPFLDLEPPKPFVDEPPVSGVVAAPAPIPAPQPPVTVPEPPPGAEAASERKAELLIELFDRTEQPVIVEEGQIERTLVLMSRSVGSTFSSLGAPLWLLLLMLAGVLTFGRISLFPAFRRRSLATGIVQWFDVEAGYGFATRDDDASEVFIHRTALRRRVKQLRSGDRIRFRVAPGPRRDFALKVMEIKPTLQVSGMEA